jgi:2-polyprenyl-3-methyl-5-hydroxy-6-metoxy-1,4-benzoquinol methylase
LADYRNRWAEALLPERYTDLQGSVLAELSRYTGCSNLDALRQRCQLPARTIEHEWQRRPPQGQQGIEEFYDTSTTYIYDLMWWHTLADEDSALGYVTALQLAEQHRCCCHLDYGAGVGSGSLLFSHNGFQTTLADISSSLLDFSKWRFEIRQRSKPHFVDLKAASLPSESFDIITAMDVFEHLADPVGAVDHLWRALRPGGFLFG